MRSRELLGTLGMMLLAVCALVLSVCDVRGQHQPQQVPQVNFTPQKAQVNFPAQQVDVNIPPPIVNLQQAAPRVNVQQEPVPVPQQLPAPIPQQQILHTPAPVQYAPPVSYAYSAPVRTIVQHDTVPVCDVVPIQTTRVVRSVTYAQPSAFRDVIPTSSAPAINIQNNVEVGQQKRGLFGGGLLGGRRNGGGNGGGVPPQAPKQQILR